MLKVTAFRQEVGKRHDKVTIRTPRGDSKSRRQNLCEPVLRPAAKPMKSLVFYDHDQRLHKSVMMFKPFRWLIFCILVSDEFQAVKVPDFRCVM